MSFLKHPSSHSFPAISLLWGVILLYALYFLILGLLHLWSFESSIVDIGSFQQILWMASKGIWPTTSINLPSHPETSWLGFHFTPLLFLLTPLYWLYSGPEWLTLIHVLCVSLTAWPIFFTCRALGAEEREAFCWSVIYLLHVTILYTAVWEFHEQSLALPLLATAFYALVVARRKLLWACVIGLMLTKEHYGLTAIGFGMLLAVRYQDYRQALLMCGAGLCMLAAVNGLIMPSLNKGAFSMFDTLKPSMENYHLSRYAWLKGAPSEVLGHALMLLKSQVNIHFYLMVLIPFGGLFIAGWMFLLPVMGELAANMLSDYFLPRMFTSYHHSTFVVGAVIAACAGAHRLAHAYDFFSSKKAALALLVMQMVVAFALIPPPSLDAFKQITSSNFFYPKALQNLVEGAAQEKAVATSKNIGVYFARREKLFKFPYGTEQADMIVLYVRPPLFSKAAWFGGEEVAQKKANGMAPSIELLLRDPQFGISFWQEGWLCLERGKAHRISPDEVRKEWKESR